MNSITEIWAKSKGTFDSKSLSQILAFAGDGKLKDNNITSKEFRDLLDHVPSSLLKQFADNCLTDGFSDSGLALQDIINQIGIRLGFNIEHGLYRGRQNDIGFDGIWSSTEGHSLVLEVKTTDAYRINLDTIAEYRRKLIEQNRISKTQSSILIVVGRQDTGDLEAQIRGSQHAWDIRLLSTDSLLKLLSLKETLNDTKTIQQINELLKPREYTRIDKLIELIFLTSKDLQLAERTDEDIDEIEELLVEKKKRKSSDDRTIQVNFHEECLIRITAKLNINFIKQTRISYTNKDKTTGLICAISKHHKQGQYEKFWFAFHPYQNDFLRTLENAWVAFGCGSPDKLFLIPYKEFEPLVQNFWTTENEDRMYWHVVIHNRENKYLLAQPQIEKGSMVDITKYKL
ncbi:hypothetical protein [Confluentibacter lentus]|uniref:hypothetical protein n=1 Tax=Confluentibacter lentus TaxID=1699412 RepID=UPI000C282A9A|nr:hypothetical protein [Confluentibacter lentus]